jgi:CheY-like chemotaxis protein
MKPARLPLLLLVEDDDLDALIVKRSLRELEIRCKLIHAKDGEEALEYLFARSSDLPCAILLDLNMPRMDGFEFLHCAQSYAKLRHIPVLILTTSTSELDRIESLKRGATRYIVKTLDADAFRESLRCVQEYCELATVP